MTEQEILTKAIEKAITKGFDGRKFVDTELFYRLQDVGVYDVIFNHDFAKALWGEAELQGLDLVMADPDLFTGAKGATHYWRYHLQQMVISDDPIKYLGEHLDD